MSGGRNKSPKGKGGASHVCGICHRAFGSAGALKDHQQAKHPPAQRKSPGSRGRRDFNPIPLEKGIAVTDKMLNRLSQSRSSQSRDSKIRLPTIGSTAAGTAWARRALHPCDDSLAGAAAVPDISSVNSCTIEVRGTVVISKPQNVTTPTWDLCLLSLNTAEAIVAYRYRAAGASDWSYWHLADRQPDDEIPDEGKPLPGGTLAPGKLRIRGGGGIYHTFTRPGLVENTTQYRVTHRGLTCVLNCSNMFNGGLVTAAQWADKPEREPFPFNPGHPDTEKEIVGNSLWYKSIPETSSQLVGMVPESGQWRAAEGIYLPHRFEDPTHIYQTAEGVHVQHDTGLEETHVTASPIVLGRPAETGSENARKDLLYVNPNSGGATGWIVPSSAGSVNLTVGMVFFEGISEQASVLVKTRTGMELVPKGGSPLQDAVVKPPSEDKMALEMTHAVSRELPLVYQSKFNDWNLLLPLIKGAARMIGPVLFPWVSKTVQTWAES